VSETGRTVLLEIEGGKNTLSETLRSY